MHSEWSQFRSIVSNIQQLQAGSRATFYLLLASIVEVIAAGVACGTPNILTNVVNCNGNDIYAIVVGAISIIICVIFLRVDSEKFNGTDKALAVFLALWWAVGMGVLYVKQQVKKYRRTNV